MRTKTNKQLSNKQTNKNKKRTTIFKQ